MPKGKKLPSVPEIEKEVLAAIRKLGGEATYRAINDEVRERLKPRMYISETDKKTNHSSARSLVTRRRERVRLCGRTNL